MLFHAFSQHKKVAQEKFESLKGEDGVKKPDPEPAAPKKKPSKENKSKPAPVTAPTAAPTSSSDTSGAAKNEGAEHWASSSKPSTIAAYNGAVNDNYTWSQTLYETTVEVPMPQGTRGKDLDVVMTKQKLKVGLKGKTPVIDGDLPETINEEDSMYTIESGVVQLTLVKNKQTWWKNVVEGEPEIDTQKVDSVRNISEYDEETQAGIRKIMFDQDQKRKGLPTSDQIKNEETLKQAWNAEGSPFAGQPFDPSILNITDGAGGMPPGFPAGAGGMPPGAQGPAP